MMQVVLRLSPFDLHGEVASRDKCMKMACSLKYGVWYSIYSVVVEYRWLWLGKIDIPSRESQANFTHSLVTRVISESNMS